MSKAPTWIVTAITPGGMVCYRDRVDAYAPAVAIDTAKDRDDGRLAQRYWPAARWAAVPIGDPRR